jgi:hypothetical protein
MLYMARSRVLNKYETVIIFLICVINFLWQVIKNCVTWSLLRKWYCGMILMAAKYISLMKKKVYLEMYGLFCLAVSSWTT